MTFRSDAGKRMGVRMWSKTLHPCHLPFCPLQPSPKPPKMASNQNAPHPSLSLFLPLSSPSLVILPLILLTATHLSGGGKEQFCLFSWESETALYPPLSLTHSLSTRPFTFWHQRETPDTCDLWDIWSEWLWAMTWPKKRDNDRDKDKYKDRDNDKDKDKYNCHPAAHLCSTGPCSNFL